MCGARLTMPPLAGGETSGLLAAWQRESPMPRQPARPGLYFHGGSHRNAEPLYAIPQRRIVKDSGRVDATAHVIDSRLSYANVFAIESTMDELANACGADPLDFRLAHLDDVRARDVLEAAAERAGWKTARRSLGAAWASGLRGTRIPSAMRQW